MMKKSMRSIFLAVVFLTVLVSGCAPASTPLPTISTPLPTNTPIPATVTQTATLRPTATGILTSSLTPTDMPTSMPTPTHTPLPALPRNASDLEWIAAYGLPGDQEVTKIHPTKDGGFILVGRWVIGPSLLLKLRADGLVEWQKSLGQVTALDVLETSAGDFILAGDDRLIRFDSQGNMLWQYEVGQTSYHTGPILRLVEERNGDIVVEAAGSRTVFNADGELQSFTEDGISDPQTDPGEIRKRLDENQFNYVFFLQTTEDGGAIVGNQVVEDYGLVASWLSHVVISRVSRDGSVRWQRCCYGGHLGAGYEDFHALETKSGDIIVAGTVSYFADNEYHKDVWIIRLNRNGRLRWDKLVVTEGQDPEGQDAVTVIQELSNGDLLFAGHTSGAGTGGQDMWIVKTNAQGVIPDCGIVFGGSAGTFGDFPEVETTTLEDEQMPSGDASNASAQTIPLCSPSP
jgi:hypothetical protein